MRIYVHSNKIETKFLLDKLDMEIFEIRACYSNREANIIETFFELQK